MRKKKIWMIPVTAIVLAAIVGGFIIFQGIQNVQDVQSGYDADYTYDMEGSVLGIVSWDGKSYRYNDHLSNFLFLGVDKEELVDTEAGYLDAGQTDAIFLLAWDRVEETMTVISIPRDTMTPYEYYGRGGQSLGTEKGHLNLAYAYGDGKHESCQITVQAVSGLFYGLPIEKYCAVSLEALSEVMEEVGEVTVTVPNSSLEDRYPEYKEGTEVVLDSNTIEPFIRYRNIEVSQSAMTRLERQEVFLEAFMEKAEQRFAEDPGFVSRSYEAMQPYMVTNAGADQFAKLMECMVSKGKPEHWTVPGIGAEGVNYDEYHVDEDALYAKIIETFYIEEE